MPGLNPNVNCHHLNKQKNRCISFDKETAICKEVDRQLKIGFIREIVYPEWLANVAMVKKIYEK